MPLKKGQKLTDNPRDKQLHIRLTSEEEEMLNDCADRLELSKTEVIVQGIKKVNEELENK